MKSNNRGRGMAAFRASILAVAIALAPPAMRDARAQSATDADAAKASDTRPVLAPGVGPTIDWAVIETHGADESLPWTVLWDSSAVLVEPREGASVLATVPEGTKLSGIMGHVQFSDEEWLMVNWQGTAGFVVSASLTRHHPANVRPGDLPIGEEFINRWWGLPLDYFPSDLVDLPFALRSNREKDLRMRAEAARAMEAMVAAMERDGLGLKVVSAYRSGPTQKRIYDGKVRQRGASQRASAPPGHSEHQLGTTADVADPAMDHVLNGSFGDTPEWRWLDANSWRFGFAQSYLPTNTEHTGYIPEPWHIRYWGMEKAAAIHAARLTEAGRMLSSDEAAAASSTPSATSSVAASATPAPAASAKAEPAPAPSLREVWGSDYSKP